MANQVETKYKLQDLRVSQNGKFAAVKLRSKSESEDEHHDLLIFNLEMGKKIFEHHETSITHMEWHPAQNKLLFIGVLSGLNAVEIEDEGSKEMIEGIVQHSVLFLEYFHFSKKGKSVGYLLRNISIIPESAKLEEKNIKNIILDEEKTQLLYYEKIDAVGKVEGLGRAWNWLDEDLVLYTYQSDIYTMDIVWNSKKKIASYDEFILDFTPIGKKMIIVSIDYKNLLSSEGNFNVVLFDFDNGKTEPIKIEGNFTPEIFPLGNVLIFNRKIDENFVVSKFDLETGEETQLTSPDKISRFPRISKNKIYFLREEDGKTDLYNIDPAGEKEKKLLCISDFLDNI
ncbi:MAG: hypothetical protein K8T10_02065 [Candidatus Eremiobacteraeota bacterium]|nr:hypothetical protein [Candidatus Eremiobacteraeota bacterium]